MAFALTMTTTATREDAEAWAEGLVMNKLAACVQIAETFSVYEWEGHVNKDREFLLLIKGRSDLFEKVRGYVLAHHKYDLPELVKLDLVDGNPAYLAWMHGATSR